MLERSAAEAVACKYFQFRMGLHYNLSGLMIVGFATKMDPIARLFARRRRESEMLTERFWQGLRV